jgi:hypothetical protein
MRRDCWVSFVALVLISLTTTACFAAPGLYDSKSDVVDLTSKNFNSKVLESDGVWLVEFYAPWCKFTFISHMKRNSKLIIIENST